MSEERTGLDSEEPNVDSEAPGLASENGANTDDVVAVSDAAEEPVTAQGAPVDESPAAAEVDGDSSDEGAPAADAPDGFAAVADQRASFLIELVRAMQLTAGVERTRIAEEADRRRQAHIDGVRAREASEADRMRELADGDMQAIDFWANAESKRIKLERERRETELRDDLETSLAEHHSKIDREIEAVESAMATYRADVVAYFEALDRETDPILIAQQAGMQPAFPKLEAIGETPDASTATSSADATAGSGERAMVGVMDPGAAAATGESWAAPSETSPEAATAGASDDVDEVAETLEPAEPVPAATGPTVGASSLFASVPVLRPLSSYRRDGNGGDPPDRP